MMKSAARSKRRLAEKIGDERATEAARQLIECAREDLAAWRGSVCLAPAAPEEAAMLEADAVDAVVVQRGANLGERINHVNAALIDRGFERQLFIGIDCPAIDARYLERAAAALAECDVVLGPAIDGGVVLMGVRGRWPSLAHLPWSTDALFAALRALCAANGASIALLETLRDVDTLADLLAVGAELAGDTRPARRALARWLERCAASGFA
jgi:rSAM/selenodomain-associated transferase 1